MPAQHDLPNPIVRLNRIMILTLPTYTFHRNHTPYPSLYLAAPPTHSTGTTPPTLTIPSCPTYTFHRNHTPYPSLYLAAPPTHSTGTTPPTPHYTYTFHRNHTPYTSLYLATPPTHSTGTTPPTPHYTWPPHLHIPQEPHPLPLTIPGRPTYTFHRNHTPYPSLYLATPPTHSTGTTPPTPHYTWLPHLHIPQEPHPLPLTIPGHPSYTFHRNHTPYPSLYLAAPPTHSTGTTPPTPHYTWLPHLHIPQEPHPLPLTIPGRPTYTFHRNDTPCPSLYLAAPPTHSTGTTPPTPHYTWLPHLHIPQEPHPLPLTIPGCPTYTFHRNHTPYPSLYLATPPTHSTGTTPPTPHYTWPPHLHIPQEPHPLPLTIPGHPTYTFHRNHTPYPSLYLAAPPTHSTGTTHPTPHYTYTFHRNHTPYPSLYLHIPQEPHPLPLTIPGCPTYTFHRNHTPYPSLYLAAPPTHSTGTTPPTPHYTYTFHRNHTPYPSLYLHIPQEPHPLPLTIPTHSTGTTPPTPHYTWPPQLHIPQEPHPLPLTIPGCPTYTFHRNHTPLPLTIPGR